VNWPIGTGDGVRVHGDDRRPQEARSTGRCDVVVSGVTPAARFLDADVYDSKGHLVAQFAANATASPARRSSAAPMAGSKSGWRRARARQWLPTAASNATR